MDWFSEGDGVKIGIMVVAFALLYASARFFSSHRHSGDTVAPSLEPTEPPEPTPLPRHDFDNALSRRQDDVVQVVPSDRNVTVTLSNISFDTFDADAGPPDPKRFCSEMTVKITVSGYFVRAWEAIYPIATPEGMRDKIDREEWKVMYMPELILVDHYDLKAICEAIIEQIETGDPDAQKTPEPQTLDSAGS